MNFNELIFSNFLNMYHNFLLNYCMLHLNIYMHLYTYMYIRTSIHIYVYTHSSHKLYIYIYIYAYMSHLFTYKFGKKIRYAFSLFLSFEKRRWNTLYLIIHMYRVILYKSLSYLERYTFFLYLTLF